MVRSQELSVTPCSLSQEPNSIKSFSQFLSTSLETEPADGVRSRVDDSFSRRADRDAKEARREIGWEIRSDLKPESKGDNFRAKEPTKQLIRQLTAATRFAKAVFYPARYSLP